MKPPLVLLVDDEDELRRSTAQALDLEGLSVKRCASAERALDFITQGFNGVVLTDIRMPGMDGMTLMGRVREIDPGNSGHCRHRPCRRAACRARHARRRL